MHHNYNNIRLKIVKYPLKNDKSRHYGEKTQQIKI